MAKRRFRGSLTAQRATAAERATTPLPPAPRAYSTSGPPVKSKVPATASLVFFAKNNTLQRQTLNKSGSFSKPFKMSEAAQVAFVRKVAGSKWAAEARKPLRAFEQAHNIVPSPPKDYTNTHGGVGKPKPPAPGRRYQ